MSTQNKGGIKVKVEAVLVDFTQPGFTFEEIKCEITRALTKELYLDAEKIQITEVIE